MRYRVLPVGERRPRLWVVGVTALFVLVFSVGFVRGVETNFGTLITLCVLVVAVYAGRKRGGLLSAQAAVFVAVYWRAVFPPVIGFLRWDDAARYTTISVGQLLGVGDHLSLGPLRELTRGIELGVIYGVLAAVFLGTAAYGLGALYRHLRREDPSTHPYVTD